MAVDFMEEEVLNTLHNVLEQDPSRVAPEDQEIFVKMQSSYISCMGTQKLKNIGLAPLEDIVERIRFLLSDRKRSPSQQKPLSGPGHRLTETFLFLLKSGIQTMEILADDKAPETQAVSVWPVIVFGLPLSRFTMIRRL